MTATSLVQAFPGISPDDKTIWPNSTILRFYVRFINNSRQILSNRASLYFLSIVSFHEPQ